ncbi:MAG: hypothetical protein AB7F98_04115 [Novosphingobium sp.]
MRALFPIRHFLSIALVAGLAAAIPLVQPSAADAAPGASAPAASPWYGRWTVSEDRPVFTARGRLYKTIDIAPCGRDFCGVSVADNGACGAGLFRFFGHRARVEETLYGHGLWGREKKNVQIGTWEDNDQPGGRVVEIYLGDGHDFGDRSENMPKFHANYRRLGAARCTRR